MCQRKCREGEPHALSHPPSMDRDSHSEDTLSTMVLENIKNKLIHAFRAAGESKEDNPESSSAVRPVSLGRSYQANEELRRAQIDGAITWLRSELVRQICCLLSPCSFSHLSHPETSKCVCSAVCIEVYVIHPTR